MSTIAAVRESSQDGQMILVEKHSQGDLVAALRGSHVMRIGSARRPGGRALLERRDQL